MNTFEELLEYIKNNNINSATSTSDEILAIGKLHRNLPRNQKNWNRLAMELNYQNSGEALRLWTLRKLKATAIEESDIKSENDADIEYQTAYKEKTKMRDVYNAYRLSLRNDARVEVFKDALIDAIGKLKPLDITPISLHKLYSENKTEAVLMFSDLHIGVNCENFYNKYNAEIAAERIKKLTIDTMMACRDNNVSKLHVINLGDLIHGTIHTTARIQSDLDVVDQVTTAAELVSWMLAQFTKLGIEVTYRSCTDNHSRFTANKAENIEAENFSRIIDWYLQARLSDAPITFMDDNIDMSIGKFTLKSGKKIMFAHGHLENINKCIDAFTGATKEFIDYVLLSHYHTTKAKSYNGSKLFVNGSIVGTEEYALSRRLFSPAEQKLLIFNDNGNLTQIDINLQI